LHKTLKGPEITREPVSSEDLASARSEAWLSGCLRKGYPTLPLEELPTRLVPIYEQSHERGSASCAGFAVEATCPRGEVTHQVFPLRSLQHVATRAAMRLVATGVLQPTELYYFGLHAEPCLPGSAPAPAEPAGPVPFAMAICRHPLVWLQVPLRAMLGQASAVGLADSVGAIQDENPTTGAGGETASAGGVPQGETGSGHLSSGGAEPGAGDSVVTGSAGAELAADESSCDVCPDAGTTLDASASAAGKDNDHFPVFYTEAAFALAERFSRKGATTVPARETGAVLAGSLCSCPETGEMFAVVCEALEARDTEQTSATLFYTSKSWQGIQEVMRARQAQPSGRSLRILGQAHGHNFLPSQDPLCTSCEDIAICQRTSVFVSADDSRWSRAVFHDQPWHLCHIFGLSARGEPAHGLFGLRSGSLVLRGFHVIPDFDPAVWPLIGQDQPMGKVPIPTQ
jgi:hypothetical protein